MPAIDDQVDAAGGLRFAVLASSNAAVRTDAVAQTMDAGWVGARHSVATPAATLLLSRDPTINVGFDFQLYDRSPDYTLRLVGRDLATATPVLVTLPGTRTTDMAGTPTTGIVTITRRMDRAPTKATDDAVAPVTPRGRARVTLDAAGGVNADELERSGGAR